MRRVICVALWIAAAGCAAVQEPADSLEKCAQRTRGAEQAYITFKFSGTEGRASSTAVGDGKFWMDVKAGLYRLSVSGTVTDRGRTEKTKADMWFTPKGMIGCYEEGAKAEALHVDRDEKSTPGQFLPLKQGGPLIPWLDAPFGYEHMMAEMVFAPGEAPAKERDGLLWFEVKTKDGVDGKLFDAMRPSDGAARVWLGFSRRTGWPMKLVEQGKEGAVTLAVTGVDMKPALKGVFDLPAEAKAKMEEK